MTRRPDKTPALCECGEPSANAGKPVIGRSTQAGRCARCMAHEAAGLNCPPITCGHPHPGIHDHDILGIINLNRIATACDAFFARRALPKPSWNAIRQSNHTPAA